MNEYNMFVRQVRCKDHITIIINAVDIISNDIVISNVKDCYNANDAQSLVSEVVKALRYKHNAKAVNLIEE